MKSQGSLAASTGAGQTGNEVEHGVFFFGTGDLS
jgi:hypothetical protein